MATFEVTVEGIYESDKGSGQKDFVPFNFKTRICRFKQAGLETHILRRLIPLKCKSKNGKLFSRVKTFNIVDIQKIDDKFHLEGKDVKELDEYGIQELATMYDLYNVPLPGTTSITKLREIACLEYLRKAINIPMKEPEEKEVLPFYFKQADGTYKVDFSDQKVTIVVNNSFAEKQEKVVVKKSLESFLQKAAQSVANGILAMTGNNTIEKAPAGQGADEQNSMPSVQQLLQS